MDDGGGEGQEEHVRIWGQQCGLRGRSLGNVWPSVVVPEVEHVELGVEQLRGQEEVRMTVRPLAW